MVANYLNAVLFSSIAAALLVCLDDAVRDKNYTAATILLLLFGLNAPTAFAYCAAVAGIVP